MGKVSLTVARLKCGLIPNQRANCSGVGMKKSESIASECKSASRQVAKSKFHHLYICIAAFECASRYSILVWSFHFVFPVSNHFSPFTILPLMRYEFFAIVSFSCLFVCCASRITQEVDRF